MSMESPPRAWARDVWFTVLVIGVLALFATGLLLWLLLKDWAEAQSPWVGRIGLAVIVILVCARMVRGLVTPARSRTRSDVIAAGLVVLGGLAALYFVTVRPALRDRQRDADFEARIAVMRARSDGLEAAARELPDPAAMNSSDLNELIRLMGKALEQDLTPSTRPAWEELARYTPEQRGEVLGELRREIAALKTLNERTAELKTAIKAAIDKKAHALKRRQE